LKVAYDIKLMRPACVLVAAGMGADSHLCHSFDADDWLLAPTDDMAVYNVTDDQLQQLIQKTKAAHKEK